MKRTSKWFNVCRLRLRQYEKRYRMRLPWWLYDFVPNPDYSYDVA